MQDLSNDRLREVLALFKTDEMTGVTWRELESMASELCRHRRISEAKPSPRTFRTEFPNFDYELDFPEGFEDISWHNDTCPSMWNKSKRLTVFCDYADMAKREVHMGPGMTYSVCVTNGDGELIEGGVVRLMTDSWPEMRAFIDDWPSLTEEQWDRVDQLAADIEYNHTKMSVVDYLGYVDQKADGSIKRIEPNEADRFGVRDLGHVKVYGFRELRKNKKAAGNTL